MAIRLDRRLGRYDCVFGTWFEYFPNRRQMSAIGGLSFRRSVSATAHVRSQVRLRGICLCTKIPESQDTETGSTETRLDVALTGSEAKD
jgi:hypothetical protein